MKLTQRFALLTGTCLSLTALAPVTAFAANTSPAPRGTAGAAGATSARERALMERLEQLSADLQTLKAEMADLRRQQQSDRAAVATAAATATESASAARASAAAAASAATASNTAVLAVNGAGQDAASAPATVLTGYGEVNYNRYQRDKSKNEADVRRLVLGVQHRFDARTKLVTELEVEHSVTSASDKGEVAIEQAYVERQLNDQWAMRAGLFLMPSGLLNENHEPTAYYGVERNFVETAIIPSTWREGGLQFVGNFDQGLTLQMGVSTSFDVSKWSSTDAETADSPLGAVHQEMSQAHAKDLAFFGALNWRGVPGLQLGGSVFSGKGGQGQATAAGNGLRVSLWDLHARYMVAGWDLSAVYARGTIGGTAAFNTLTLSSGPDWYPVPKRFDGAYVQAAYKLWTSGDLSLSPFVRLERFNTRKAYADLGLGLTQTAAPTEQVRTVGANLNVGDGVVFKADIQRFQENKDRNRLDLGVGWSF